MRTYSDALGRTVRTVENFQGTGAVTETTPSDQNRTTQYVFDTKGRLAWLDALNPKGSGNGVEEQLTYYAYTNPYNASRPTAIAYPDMSPAMVSVDQNTLVVTFSGSDYVSTAFDLAGRPTSRTDQRGTVHAYTYDSAGRLEKDGVTTAGGDTDTAVLGIKFTYDTLGRRTAVTSYTDAACTAVANDVAWAYDGDAAGDLGWGGVKTSWQDHAGTAGSGDPSVQYAYADGATGTAAKFVRLSSVTYPGPATPRTVYYNYLSNASIGDHLSRLDNMADDAGGTTKYAAYTYLGSGTIVQVSRPGSTLTYKGGAGKYPGFDRLGRVVWQKWTGNEPVEGVIDRYFYGYDRGSNRIWRAERQRVLGYNPPNRDRDEGYGYDGLSRLVAAARGTLVAGSPMAAYDGDFTSDGLVNVNDYLKLTAGYGVGDEWSEGDIDGDGNINVNDYLHFNVVYGNQPTRNVVQSWSWSLDSLGNWGGYNVTTSAGTLNQTRTHDAANELINISSTGGTNWVSPTYDAAGNMTSGPKPSDESNRIHLKYDSWNRMVKASADNGSGGPGEMIAEYRRDGQGRRTGKIVRTTSGETVSYVRTDFYYNDSWQVVEERRQSFESLETARATPAGPVYCQYLWDVRYIDAPVCRWRDTNSDGTLDETLYYCNDANMNVTALVDTSGNVVERYNYTPYGTVTVYDSAWNVRAGGSAYDNSILYCGYRFDWETGLYDVRNRILWPNIGRWGQGDPMVYTDGANLRAYCRSSPVGAVDPQGLKGKWKVRQLTERVFDNKQFDNKGLPGIWYSTLEKWWAEVWVGHILTPVPSATPNPLVKDPDQQVLVALGVESHFWYQDLGWAPTLIGPFFATGTIHASSKAYLEAKCDEDSGIWIIQKNKDTQFVQWVYADTNITWDTNYTDKNKHYLYVTSAWRAGYSANVGSSGGLNGGASMVASGGGSLGWSVSYEGGVSKGGEHTSTFVCECEQEATPGGAK